MSDERLFRRILNLIAIGRTTAPALETGGVSTVQIEINSIATADKRKMVGWFGFYASPPVGTDVVEVRVHGDPSNGVVIGTNNQALRPTGLQPGEAIMYDAFGKSIYFTKAGGIVINANGANVTIENTAQVLVPNGDVIAGPNNISLINHVHIDAGGSGDSGPPKA